MSELSQIRGAYQNLRDKGEKPNFLFIGGGLSDVSQFDAFALYAKNLGIKLCGIIYDVSLQGGSNKFDEKHVLGLAPDEYELVHKTDGSSLSEGSFFRALKEMVQGCFIKLPSRLKSMGSLQLECLREIDDPFFLIYPKCGPLPPYALAFLAAIEQKKVIHIVLEEGIGSYLMTLRDWWFLGVNRELNPLIKILKSIVLHLLWPPKRKQLSGVSKAITSLSFTLFEEGEVLQKNEISCSYYKRALEGIAAQRSIPSLDFSDTVIIAATGFENFNASDFEIDCIRLVASILRKYGYRVILRPHPAEKRVEHYEGLSVEMDPHMDVSLETQIAVSRVPPVAILGFMSSAQLIANALWGIEAICLSGVLGERWSKLSKDNGALGLLDREIQDAKGLFKGYVKFPDNALQLEREIASLRQERSTSI